MQLAQKGEWDQAEAHWMSAMSNALTSMSALAMKGDPAEADDAAAMSAFYQLGLDASRIALDQATSQPIADDVATYTTDLATYNGYVAGC